MPKTKSAPETKFLEIKAKITALREQAKKECQTFFKESATELFEKHPELKSFSFTAYTPYFNDGDLCEYSAHTDYLDMTMKDGTEEEYYDGQHGSKKELDTPLKKAGLDAIKFLKSFDDEDYEAMFGDHVRITVTAKGVDIDTYEHD